MPNSIIIVGAGPNLGAAVARRFGREGLAVGLVSRNAEKLATMTQTLTAAGLTAAYAAADIRDPSALSTAIGSLAEQLGPVEVLEYSPLPAREFMKPVLETSVEEVRGPLEFSVLGAVAAATAVVQPMLDRGHGTILFTTGGAAINPYPLRAGVGISFAAHRPLDLSGSPRDRLSPAQATGSHPGPGELLGAQLRSPVSWSSRRALVWTTIGSTRCSPTPSAAAPRLPAADLRSLPLAAILAAQPRRDPRLKPPELRRVEVRHAAALLHGPASCSRRHSDLFRSCPHSS